MLPHQSSQSRSRCKKKGHEIVFRVMGKNRIAAWRKRDGLTGHWMPRIGPLKGDPRGGRPEEETKAGRNQSFAPPSPSSATTNRAELGPIKSEPIFVERPIKPLENLIDCSGPIRERGRGIKSEGPLSEFHSQCIRYHRQSAAPPLLLIVIC